MGPGRRGTGRVTPGGEHGGAWEEGERGGSKGEKGLSLRGEGGCTIRPIFTTCREEGQGDGGGGWETGSCGGAGGPSDATRPGEGRSSGEEADRSSGEWVGLKIPGRPTFSNLKPQSRSGSNSPRGLGLEESF